MGLLIIVGVIATGLGFLAATAVYWIARAFFRPRWRVVLAGVIGSLVCFMSFVPVFQWLRSATTITVIGASSEVADRVMAFLDLPPGTATDFSYCRLISGTLVADFLMTEDNYLRWMKLRECQPARILEGGAEVWQVRHYETGISLLVTRGWCASFQKPDSPGSTERFTYDADTGRVYFLVTHF